MNRPLFLGALAALALAAAEIFWLHLAQPLENRLVDLYVRAHAARLAPDPDIMLVDIDEKSLASMQDAAGRWPWPRAVHGELIEGLAAQRPRAIVFDIMFSEPDRFRPESDRAFVEAVAAHPNTWFPLLRLDPKDDPKGARGRRRRGARTGAAAWRRPRGAHRAGSAAGAAAGSVACRNDQFRRG